jgi:hypothetical protein
MLSALAAQREAVVSGDELLVGATEIGERPVTRGPRMLTAVQQQWIGRAGRSWASSGPSEISALVWLLLSLRMGR